MILTERGQSLIELIVVITVTVLIVGALTFATISALRNAQFATNQAQATKLAQDGIEKVRIGRDRNQCIKNLDSLGTQVNSWDGNNSSIDCNNLSGSIWDYRIGGGHCGDSDIQGSSPTYCYFNIKNDGILEYLTSYSPKKDMKYPPNVEEVGSSFKRMVILSDYSENDSFKTQKTVTVIVAWNDFSGFHESKLTTILGKL